jgi:hypothetical protein
MAGKCTKSLKNEVYSWENHQMKNCSSRHWERANTPNLGLWWCFLFAMILWMLGLFGWKPDFECLGLPWNAPGPQCMCHHHNHHHNNILSIISFSHFLILIIILILSLINVHLHLYFHVHLLLCFCLFFLTLISCSSSSASSSSYSSSSSSYFAFNVWFAGRLNWGHSGWAPVNSATKHGQDLCFCWFLFYAWYTIALSFTGLRVRNHSVRSARCFASKVRETWFSSKDHCRATRRGDSWYLVPSWSGKKQPLKTVGEWIYAKIANAKKTMEIHVGERDGTIHVRARILVPRLVKPPVGETTCVLVLWCWVRQRKLMVHHLSICVCQ